MVGAERHTFPDGSTFESVGIEPSVSIERHISDVRNGVDPILEKAKAIRVRLVAGEDFATIAKAESDDKGSGAQGGDLGCQPKGSFVREFEDAEAALQPGQTSGPVQSQFGFHVIQVLSRKTQTLEEAAPQIRQRIQSQNRSAISSFIDRALAKAKITVNFTISTN